MYIPPPYFPGGSIQEISGTHSGHDFRGESHPELTRVLPIGIGCAKLWLWQELLT